jgi:hypothetical protein
MGKRRSDRSPAPFLTAQQKPVRPTLSVSRTASKRAQPLPRPRRSAGGAADTSGDEGELSVGENDVEAVRLRAHLARHPGEGERHQRDGRAHGGPARFGVGVPRRGPALERRQDVHGLARGRPGRQHVASKQCTSLESRWLNLRIQKALEKSPRKRESLERGVGPRRTPGSGTMSRKNNKGRRQARRDRTPSQRLAPARATEPSRQEPSLTPEQRARVLMRFSTMRFRNFTVSFAPAFAATFDTWFEVKTPEEMAEVVRQQLPDDSKGKPQN